MGEEEANDLPFKINKLAMAFQMLRNKPYGLVDFLQIWSMLDLGHNPNDKDDLGWPPIVYAAFGGHIHVTRLLLHYKANVNANNRVRPLQPADRFLFSNHSSTSSTKPHSQPLVGNATTH